MYLAKISIRGDTGVLVPTVFVHDKMLQIMLFGSSFGGNDLEFKVNHGGHWWRAFYELTTLELEEVLLALTGKREFKNLLAFDRQRDDAIREVQALLRIRKQVHRDILEAEFTKKLLAVEQNTPNVYGNLSWSES